MPCSIPFCIEFVNAVMCSKSKALFKMYDQKQALHEWINNWNDFADFEIISVITIINA